MSDIKLKFNNFFDMSEPIDTGVTDAEAIKISLWAKNVLADDYFQKIITGISTDSITSILDCQNKDSIEVINQIKGSTRTLRWLSREIERLSNIK